MLPSPASYNGGDRCGVRVDRARRTHMSDCCGVNSIALLSACRRPARGRPRLATGCPGPHRRDRSACLAQRLSCASLTLSFCCDPSKLPRLTQHGPNSSRSLSSSVPIWPFFASICTKSQCWGFRFSSGHSSKGTLLPELRASTNHDVLFAARNGTFACPSSNSPTHAAGPANTRTAIIGEQLARPGWWAPPRPFGVRVSLDRMGHRPARSCIVRAADGAPGDPLSLLYHQAVRRGSYANAMGLHPN